jgi:tetratricopeptide (TPR) repeat protein
MRGKAPPRESKPSRDYLHVDVCARWLDAHVGRSGAHHQFDNSSRGVAQLINLCRQLGVSKINMKATDEHGARAYHALTVAGLSVTASNPLRARMFADAGRAGKAWRVRAISLMSVAIALGFAGLAAWRWDRDARVLASATERAKELSFDATQKFANAPGALASYLKDVLGSLVASNRSDEDEERDLPVAHGKIGGVQLSQGDRAAALQSSREVIEIFKTLSAADPGDKSRRQGLPGDDETRGDVSPASADPAAALQAYGDRLALAKAFSAADPGDIARRRDLAVAQQMLGDIQAAQGDLAAALQSYRDSFAVAKALSAAEPGDDGRRRDLAVAQQKLGDIQAAQADPAAALQSYRDSFAVVEALSAAAPADIGRRRDLALAYEKLGDVQAAQGDPAAALQSYRRSFDIIKALSVVNPGDIGLRRDLAVVYEKLGDVPLVQGDRTTAAQSYRDSLALFKALLVVAPRDDEGRRDMIAIYMKLSVAEPSNAREYLSNAQAIVKELADKGRLTSSDRAWAAEIDKRFKGLGASADVASPGKPNR